MVAVDPTRVRSRARQITPSVPRRRVRQSGVGGMSLGMVIFLGALAFLLFGDILLSR